MRYLGTIAALGLMLAVTATAGAVTIDGIKGSGEWDGAQQWSIADGMGTVYGVANGAYLNLLFEITDSTDARLGQNVHGNDQLSANINPTLGAPWGMPCDIIFQSGADCAAWGGVSSGTSDGWETQWQLDGVQQTSLPADLLTMTLYGGGIRTTEWQIPLASISPSVGDVLRIGGAADVGDGKSYVYPVGLDWSDVDTYGQLKVVPEPVTMAGLVLGIGALGGYLRRRKA